MALIDDIIGILQDAYDSSLTGLSATQTIATLGRYLAGIGGMFYIGKSVMGQIARNESINFIPLIRPIFFLMAVGWSSNICDSIDSICNSIAITSSGDVQKMKEAYETYDNQLEKTIELKWANIAKNEKDYDAQFGDGAYASTTFDWERNVVIGVSKFKDDFVAGLLDVITEILQWINYFAFMVMYLMSFLFRICLRAVAPIAIGIAIFDGFSNNAVEWLGKYINYALLPAIANLYGAISFNILTKMMITLTSAGIVGDENAKNTSYDITTMGAVYVAVLVVLIIGWFFIPTIANMVVSVGGSSAAAQGFAARSAALGAGATAGAKMTARNSIIASGAISGGIKEGYAGVVNGGKTGISMGQNAGMGNYGSSALGMASAIGGGIYNGAIGAFKGGGDANVAAKKMRRRASYRYGSGRYGA